MTQAVMAKQPGFPTNWLSQKNSTSTSIREMEKSLLALPLVMRTPNLVLGRLSDLTVEKELS